MRVLVYLAAGLAVLHFVLLTKGALRRPALYGGALVVLLAARTRWVRSTVDGFRERRELR